MDNVLGIVYFEKYNVKVGEMNKDYNISTLSFLGRYRIIDFLLSNMSNSGINEIQIYNNKSTKSLIEHIGDGTNYNINSKKGNISIFPVGFESTHNLYNHDIATFKKYIRYIRDSKSQYILIAPSHYIYKVDFKSVYNAHINSNSDITVLYSKEKNCKVEFTDCNILNLNDDDTIKSFKKNTATANVCDVALDAYLINKDVFLNIIKTAPQISEMYELSDMINEYTSKFKVTGYKVKNNVHLINSLNAYFEKSLLLKDCVAIKKSYDENWPLYTLTNDSSPTIYGEDVVIKNSLISNGCTIDGNVENCVIGRNVVIKKGTRCKNCIILAESFIAADSYLENVIVDKSANVFHTKKIVGTKENPIYIQRFGIV